MYYRDISSTESKDGGRAAQGGGGRRR